jgi:hypothetical protein
MKNAPRRLSVPELKDMALQVEAMATALLLHMWEVTDKNSPERRTFRREVVDPVIEVSNMLDVCIACPTKDGFIPE